MTAGPDGRRQPARCCRVRRRGLGGRGWNTSALDLTRAFVQHAEHPGGHMAQYDAIALNYQQISAAVPLRDAEWHSLRVRLGELTGRSVLDLACGDGMGTRLLRRWGAGPV